MTGREKRAKSGADIAITLNGKIAAVWPFYRLPLAEIKRARQYAFRRRQQNRNIRQIFYAADVVNMAVGQDKQINIRKAALAKRVL